MYMHEVPSCCAAKVAVSFDENNSDRTDHRWGDTRADSPHVVFKWVKEKIATCKKNGDAILMFNTKSDQVMINEVLFLLGAESTGWLKKTKHLETNLRTWWFPLHEYRTPDGNITTLREKHKDELRAFMAEARDLTTSEKYADEIWGRVNDEQMAAIAEMGKE